MEQLEADLRDHLIAAQQEKDLGPDDLRGIGLNYLKDYALFGDGNAERMTASAEPRNADSADGGETQLGQQQDGAQGIGDPDMAEVMRGDMQREEEERKQRQSKQPQGGDAGNVQGIDDPDMADMLHGDMQREEEERKQRLGEQPEGGASGSAVLGQQSAIAQNPNTAARGNRNAKGNADSAPSAQGGRIYVTKKDEHDIYKISESTGIPIESLKAFNKFKSIWSIRPGTKITLPPQPPEDAAHTPVIDIGKATRNINKHAQPDFTGNCGQHLYDAIDAGLPDGKKIERPKSHLAKDAGTALEGLGFTKVLSSANELATYIPKKGDVVVLQDYPGQHKKDGTPLPAGHVAMFDGKYWVSDKIQNGTHRIWAGSGFEGNRVGMAVYRP